MDKKGAEPPAPTEPSVGPTGRQGGAARVRQGAGPRPTRNPLEEFAEELGRLAARDILNDLCMISAPELLFVLALVYAVVVAALHAHAMHVSTAMTALPY